MSHTPAAGNDGPVETVRRLIVHFQQMSETLDELRRLDEPVRPPSGVTTAGARRPDRFKEAAGRIDKQRRTGMAGGHCERMTTKERIAPPFRRSLLSVRGSRVETYSGGTVACVKDVRLNGHAEPIKGLVDASRAVSVIKRSAAKKYGMNVVPCKVNLNVFGSAPCGETEATVGIDAYDKQVKLLVVPDSLVSYDMIVGRTFLLQRRLPTVRRII